jgi:hypothetical protein
MRAKTTLGILMVMAMAIMMSAMASAACVTTWDTPSATGSTVTGAQIFNLSIACTATTADTGNASKTFFEYKLTTASTWTALNATNTSNVTEILGAKGGIFRTSFDTNVLYDTQIYQVRVTAYNGTGDQVAQDTTLAALYVDNHNPATPIFDVLKSNTRVDKSATITGQVKNASTCTLRIYDTGVTSYKEFTATLNSDTTGSETCSYKLQAGDVTAGSKRQVSFVATEALGSGPDSTEGIVEYITFYEDSSPSKAAAMAYQKTAAAEAEAKNQPTLAGVAMIGAAIYGVYWLFKRK